MPRIALMQAVIALHCVVGSTAVAVDARGLNGSLVQANSSIQSSSRDLGGVFGVTISDSALQSLCPNRGVAAEVVFQDVMHRGNRKKLKRALQRALELAACGAVVAASLGGVLTPLSKVFTKYFGDAKQNRTATTQAVHATFVAARNVMVDGVAIRQVDSTEPRCRCPTKDTRPLVLRVTAPYICPDERLGAFVEFHGGAVIKDNQGRPWINVCVDSHAEITDLLAATVLHEAVHIADYLVTDVPLENDVKAYGPEKCKSLAAESEGLALLNADSYVSFIIECLQVKDELLSRRRTEAFYESFRHLGL
ncbi:unnamed protein product [Symbiodinium sp. CCMP2592]|nr:unnamed protein product [Symbiodinium sp. CCMP2592]